MKLMANEQGYRVTEGLDNPETDRSCLALESRPHHGSQYQRST